MKKNIYNSLIILGILILIVNGVFFLPTRAGGVISALISSVLMLGLVSFILGIIPAKLLKDKVKNSKLAIMSILFLILSLITIIGSIVKTF